MEKIDKDYKRRTWRILTDISRFANRDVAALSLEQRFSVEIYLTIFYDTSDAVSPSINVRPTGKTVTEGDIAAFHCTATGNPAPEITWFKDGKIVGQGETHSLMASRNQSGKYWCLADNGLNISVNASADLDVQCKYRTRV